ncbi:PAS domain-containing protein [Paraglaciecola sp.]|nr:PAS domain-containing protein [Paraglaciecola sp.]MDB4281994.1 PAS domain-containing protein [Paraglaciecola sp.]
MSDLHNKISITEKDLHRKAEEFVSELEQNKTGNTPKLQELSITEIKQIVHELRVHQIQLEMQNEHLRTAQIEIDASRDRYFELYDMSPVGYCTLNEAGIIEEVNLTLASLLGIPRSKLLMKPLSSLIYRDDQDNYYLKTKLMKVNGQPFSCELRMLTSDRELLWVHLASSSRKKADGTVEFHIGVSDITEQRMLQQQQRIAAIAFESLDGMFITDAQGLILQVNRAFIAMSGYSYKEVVGQTRDIFDSGRHPTSFFIEMRKNLKQQGKWSGEIWDRRKNGEVYPIWMTITTVKNNEADVSHCVYTLCVHTERHY